LDRNNVFISAGGAKQALNMLLKLFIDPGNNVLIFGPHWVSYPEMIKMVGGVPYVYNLYAKERGQIDWEDLECRLGAIRARVIILNNPTNPTGRVWSEGELRRLGRIAIEHRCVVLSDDVYNAFIYEGQHHLLSALFPNYLDQFISVNSFSKTYAMMGYRIGHVIASDRIISRLTDIQSHFSSGAQTFGQYLAAEIMQGFDLEVALMKKEFAKMRQAVMTALNEAGLEYWQPDGAFYAFFKVPEGRYVNDSIGFCDALENEHGVAMVPGNDFGAPGYVRMSYAANSKELFPALLWLKEFVQKL
jgi:aspartate aminotransferase